jgi:GTP-binding protein EngB required for normal cell division
VVTGSLDRRLQALGEAAELARGRLDDADVAAAEAVVRRAGERLGLGVEATVIALAGPTGAGKSSLFNALAGDELVAAGRRRPMTSTATAAIWGDVPGPLLDWLEVPRRHQRNGGAPQGMVLLDLPDFDSVQRTHRVEVERVLELADLLVWVVDPQKYADAAWHDRYLRTMAGHAGVMEVVLNQADTLGDGGVEACRTDLERLLRADGLPALPVHAVSARTGAGLEELRRAIDRRARERSAAVARLAADVGAAASRLGAGCGEGRGGRIGRGDRDRLVSALAAAAGVPTVVRAVDRAHRRRGALATGWPAARSLRRLRPDPLKRLRLPDRGGEEGTRPSLPAPTAVQEAGVATASRALAAAAADGLPDPWPRLVREAATRNEAAATDVLTATMGGVDLRLREPRWWRVVDGLQRVLLAVAAAGALWLLVLVGLAWLRLDDVVPTPEFHGLEIPTLLAVGGTLAGLLVALLARAVNGVGARRRARRAERRLRSRVAEIADAQIVAPVEAEIETRTRLCDAVRRAGRGR